MPCLLRYFKHRLRHSIFTYLVILGNLLSYNLHFICVLTNLLSVSKSMIKVTFGLFCILTTIKGCKTLECPTADDTKCDSYWNALLSNHGENLFQNSTKECLGEPNYPLNVNVTLQQMQVVNIDEQAKVYRIIIS